MSLELPSSRDVNVAYLGESLRLAIELDSTAGVLKWAKAFDDARNDLRIADCRVLLSALHAAETTLSPFAQAVVLQCQGTLHLRLGELRLARERYLRSVEKYGSIQDNLGQAGALCDLGTVFLIQEHFPHAHEVLSRALVILRGRRSPAEAATLNNLALVYRSRGSMTEAMETATQALDIYRSLDNLTGWAQVQINRGTILLEQGDLCLSSMAFRGALRELRAASNVWDVPRVMLGFGRLQRRRGRFVAAEGAYSSCIEGARHTNDLETQRDGLSGLAHVLQLRGDSAGAGAAYREVIATCQLLEQSEAEALGRINLGITHSLQRDYEAAQRSFEVAIAIAERSVESRHVLATARMHLGTAYRDRKDLDAAQASYEHAQIDADVTGDPVLRARLLSARATLCDLQGHFRDAEDLLDKAQDAYRLVGDRFGETEVLYKKSLLLEKQHRLDEALDIGERALQMAEQHNLGRLAMSCLWHVGDLQYQRGEATWWKASLRAVGLAFLAQNSHFAERAMIVVIDHFSELSLTHARLQSLIPQIRKEWDELGVPASGQDLLLRGIDSLS